MSNLKVALIGSGYIASVKHLPALQNLRKSAQTAAIVDLNVDQANELAGKFDVPAVYSDMAEMLEKEKPDVVDICTPPKTHAPIALQCLEAGAHVLIEKPMCQTIDECDQVMEAAKKHSRKICLAHSDLFYPSFMRARKMVEAGEIGEFRGMRIHLSTPLDYITSKPDHWAHKLPGGVLGETGPHIVYMTLAFINPIMDTQIMGRKRLEQYPWSPYEDYRISLAGESATCTATLIYSTTQWAAQVDLWGTDGSVRIDLESQYLVHSRRQELKLVPVGLSSLSEATQIVTSGIRTAVNVVSGRHVQTHQQLMHQFFDSISNGSKSPVPGEEGREAIRVMNLLTDQLDAAAGKG